MDATVGRNVVRCMAAAIGVTFVGVNPTRDTVSPSFLAYGKCAHNV